MPRQSDVAAILQWGRLGLLLLGSTSLSINLQAFHVQKYVKAARLPKFCTCRLHLSCEHHLCCKVQLVTMTGLLCTGSTAIKTS